METGKWVYAYKLADPAQLIAQRDRIERVLLQCLGLKPNPSKYHFSIAPLCGWMYFEDLKYVPRALGTGNEVNPVQVVQAFVTAVGKAITEENSLGKGASAPIPKLIPDRLRPVEVIPYYASKRRISHWTLVYAVLLRDSEEFGSSDLPVRNAYLYFTVSAKGKIVGFNWQWRPVSAILRSQELALEQEEGHESEVENVPRVFILQGESSIQTHLAPYYWLTSGHHASIHSASRHSLNIVVVKTVSGDEITLTAIMEGGSGNFSYSWAWWNLMDENSYKDLGNDREIVLPVSAGVISILVEDLDLGIRVQRQESIYFLGEEAMDDVVETAHEHSA
jgi:hypothetical protein